MLFEAKVRRLDHSCEVRDRAYPVGLLTGQPAVEAHRPREDFGYSNCWSAVVIVLKIVYWRVEESGRK